MSTENSNQIDRYDVACCNCLHYGRVSSWIKSEIPFAYLSCSGECRFNPPCVHTAANGVGLAVFPIVKDDMWCDKYIHVENEYA